MLGLQAIGKAVHVGLSMYMDGMQHLDLALPWHAMISLCCAGKRSGQASSNKNGRTGPRKRPHTVCNSVMRLVTQAWQSNADPQCDSCSS